MSSYPVVDHLTDYIKAKGLIEGLKVLNAALMRYDSFLAQKTDEELKQYDTELLDTAMKMMDQILYRPATLREVIKNLPSPNKTFENKVLYLTTVVDKHYIVHSNGDIERTDMYLPPDGQWKLWALSPRGPGSVISLAEITPDFVDKANLREYTVLDYDHGTNRGWGDKLVSILFFDKAEDTPYYKHNRRWLAEKSSR